MTTTRYGFLPEEDKSSTTMMMSSRSSINMSSSSIGSRLSAANNGSRRLDDELLRLYDSETSKRYRKQPLKLYGRESEQQVLRDSFQRTIANSIDGLSVTSSKKELVLLSGPSGSGKTALVDHTLRPLVAGAGGFFLAGKFDPNKRGIPHHVFCQALTRYATQLAEESSPKNLQAVRESLSRAVGSEEGRMLIAMVPALGLLLSQEDNDRDHDNNRARRPSLTKAQPEAIHRFRFVFLNLMKAICEHHPIVLFLDDLQWADTASLELMRAILLHMKGVPLLLVGAHRPLGNSNSSSNPSKSNSGAFTSITTTPTFSPVLETINEWNRMSVGVQVSLKPLTEHHVNELLADILRHTPEHTLPLAQVVSSQTQGNPFHVLQFLRLLKDQGFLYLNDGGDGFEEPVWCWNRQEINSQRLHAHSVLELVKEKLKKLPQFVQELLRVASCMGDQVDDSALAIVMMQGMARPTTSLHDGLQTAATSGFLLFLPQTGGYRFAHDRIKEAAYETIENKAAFLLKIGRKLWKSSSATALMSNVFLVVGIMNKGSSLLLEEDELPPMPMKERYRLAELNLMAGKKALKLVSFHDAYIYFEKGVELLGHNCSACWKTSYQLCLELYSLHADILVWKADYDRVQDLIATIFEQTKTRPLEDRLPAYSTLMTCLGQQGDYALAVKTGLDVLQKLGYALPKKATKLVIVRELLRTKCALRGKTNGYILNKLGSMTSPKMIQVAKVLNQMFSLCYAMRSPYAPIVAFRSIRVCLKYGLHEGAAIGFATYGVIICGATRQVHEGYRWGQLAILLMEAQQLKELLPQVYMFIVIGIHHWTMPLKESIDKFNFAHRVGWETGDVAHAMINAVSSLCYSFFSGTPLNILQQEAASYSQQLEAHKQENPLLWLNAIAQMMDNLCGVPGQNGSPLSVLNGHRLQLEEALMEASTTHNASATITIHLCSSIVAYVFGDYERAVSHAQKGEDAIQRPAATYLSTVILFYSGLASIALAKKRTCPRKRRSQLLKKASRDQKKLALYARDSPWNYTHKANLLKAEIKSARASQTIDCDNAILTLYHQAIQGAEREGFIQEAAMACECAAQYVMKQGEEPFSSERYLTQAHGHYLRWGATAKAAALVPRLVEVSGDFSPSATSTNADNNNGAASGEFRLPGEL